MNVKSLNLVVVSLLTLGVCSNAAAVAVPATDNCFHQNFVETKYGMSWGRKDVAGQITKQAVKLGGAVWWCGEDECSPMDNISAKRVKNPNSWDKRRKAGDKWGLYVYLPNAKDEYGQNTAGNIFEAASLYNQCHYEGYALTY